ncbi:MAG: hypothetical protein J6Y98_09970 [Bacteroidales bacterium]|nr:hypothetical protein [Bacteroidales bacterium]
MPQDIEYVEGLLCAETMVEKTIIAAHRINVLVCLLIVYLYCLWYSFNWRFKKSLVGSKPLLSVTLLWLITSTLLYFGRENEFAFRSAFATPGIMSKFILLSFCATFPCLIKFGSISGGTLPSLIFNFVCCQTK